MVSFKSSHFFLYSTSASPLQKQKFFTIACSQAPAPIKDFSVFLVIFKNSVANLLLSAPLDPFPSVVYANSLTFETLKVSYLLSNFNRVTNLFRSYVEKTVTI